MSTPALWTPELVAAIEGEALQAGFSRVGIATATPAAAEPERFAAWVEAGRAGEMQYLKRKDDEERYVRESLVRAIPWARSVVVCAFDYNDSPVRSIDPAPAATGWIARYAQSGRVGQNGAPAAPTDYHDELLVRLRQIEHRLQQLAPCQSRCYVDTGPLVERALTSRAGIGWIGKNTCVLDQELGSWLLLGVLITSLEIAPAVPLAADRCGSCTRCIDACPTDALVAPREMDASRCIAYLTIEKKGAIPEELRAPMGRQIFGCDICQDVCPWNNRTRNSTNSRTDSSADSRSNTRSQVPQPEQSRAPGMETRPELVNPSLSELAAMDSAAFKRAFKGSPLERTGRKRLHRNVAIAMGNSGQQEFRPQLEQWASAEDDAVLSEAAAWALQELGVHSALSTGSGAAGTEPGTPGGRTPSVEAPK